MRRRHRLDEGVSGKLLLPGNLDYGRPLRGRLLAAYYRSGKYKLHCVFSSDFQKIPFDENDVRKIIAEVQATSWRLRECIRAKELAAMHRLGQMSRLRMVGEKNAWKREAGFDYIDTSAEMVAQRFRTNLVSKPFPARCSIRDGPILPTNSRLKCELTSSD